MRGSATLAIKAKYKRSPSHSRTNTPLFTMGYIVAATIISVARCVLFFDASGMVRRSELEECSAGP